MDSAALSALSPVDGRYRKAADGLRAVLSESGLIRERIRIEAAWLLMLAESVPELSPKPLADPVKQLAASLALEPGDDAAGGGQGHRGAHQPRREGRGIFRAREAHAKRRHAGDARAGALRLHLRGHQQPRLRAHAARRAHPAVGRARETDRTPARLRARTRRAADAVAHPRPDRQPDHARQGIRQRGGAAAARAHAPGQGGDPRQVEWRRRQLQRARRRAAQGRLAEGQCRVRRVAGLLVERILHADRAARLDRANSATRSRPSTPSWWISRAIPGATSRSDTCGNARWPAKSAPPPCPTRSTRSISKMRKAISASPMRCCTISPASCRFPAGSATSPTRRCCATSAWRWRTA